MNDKVPEWRWKPWLPSASDTCGDIVDEDDLTVADNVPAEFGLLMAAAPKLLAIVKQLVDDDREIVPFLIDEAEKLLADLKPEDE